MTYQPIRLRVVAAHDSRPGEPVVLEGASPAGRYTTVFEDDGETGYFYAVDLEWPAESPIVDALGVYNVDQVPGRVRLVEVGWSDDGTKAMLRLDQHPVAVYDFAARRGWCRSGFPPRTTSGWTSFGHAWEDEALDLFR
jgi:hypothetical protein